MGGGGGVDRTVPCGRMVAPHRRGAAPPGDEILRGHGREQQRELQHGGGRQLRHDASGGCGRLLDQDLKKKKSCLMRHVGHACKNKTHREALRTGQTGALIWFDPRIYGK